MLRPYELPTTEVAARQGDLWRKGVDVSLAQHVADLCVFLVVVLAPLPLCLSVLVATADEEGPRGPAHSALVLLACWGITETVVGLMLGLAQHLVITWLIAAEALVLAAGLLALRHVRRAKRCPTAAMLFMPTRPLSMSDVLILGPLACLGVSLLWTLSVQPINEWDSLAYHLPTLANWYHAGRFVRLEPQSAVTSSYPGGWEVLSAVLLMPFREDFLVALPNLAAWVLLGLSVYCISCEVGARRTAALGGGALALTLPCVADNVNTIHADIGLGAYFMAAVYFALLYLRKQSMSWVGLCLAALGIAIGAKTSGLVYGVLPPGMLVLFRLAARRKGQRAPGAGRRVGRAVAVAGACCCLLTGGFWYVRNWVELGNPFAPVAVRIAGIIVLPGLVQPAQLRATTLLAVFRPLSSAYWRSALADARDYLGLSFVGLGLLALTAVPALGVKKKAISNRRLLGLVALAALAGIVHGVTPFSGQHGSNLRYAGPFYGSLAVIAAAGATATGVPPFAVAGVALIGTLSRLVALRTSFTLLLFGAGWGAAWALRRIRAGAARRRGMGRAVLLAIVAASAAALILVSFVARQKRVGHRSMVYGPILDYIATEVGPEEKIGYLASPQSYLFYGTDFRREVVYIPLRSRDRNEWLGYLARNGIAVVGAGPVPSESDDREYLDWLSGPEGPLVRVFGADPGRPYLYRVKPVAATSAAR
jgi:4-amino-4-deoxy-L-arabinose transferase-like glycosyltransferase